MKEKSQLWAQFSLTWANWERRAIPYSVQALLLAVCSGHFSWSCPEGPYVVLGIKVAIFKISTLIPLLSFGHTFWIHKVKISKEIFFSLLMMEKPPKRHHWAPVVLGQDGQLNDKGWWYGTTWDQWCWGAWAIFHDFEEMERHDVLEIELRSSDIQICISWAMSLSSIYSFFILFLLWKTEYQLWETVDFSKKNLQSFLEDSDDSFSGGPDTSVLILDLYQHS